MVIKKYSQSFNPKTILFGNGELVNHPILIKSLEAAKTIICLDGGVNKLKKLGHEPDLILGDMDSIDLKPDNYNCEILELSNQSTNDMDKGLQWCLENNKNDILLTGLSGKRDDHTMAALLSMVLFSKKLKLAMVTNHSTIHCIKKRTKIQVDDGQLISIMAKNPLTKIKTNGLQYKLRNEQLTSAGHGISNIATSNQIEIEASDWIWVFINHMA